MRKSGKKPLLQESLNELIQKFSQQDVIAVMEKEYQSAPSRLIPLSLIDDTPYIAEVAYPEDEIALFSAGLKEKGFYNPLVVRPKKEGRYELILGRKRYFGALKAGILSVPCAVKEAGDEELLLMLLADTSDQRDSNVIELAFTYEALQRKFGYTQDTLAKLSHQSRPQVTNVLRMLKLPKEIRRMISVKELSYGHAKAIASLEEKDIRAAVKAIKTKNLSVRATEEYVSGKLSGALDKAEADYEVVEENATSVTFAFPSEEAKERFLKKLNK